jgi:cytochrome b561
MNMHPASRRPPRYADTEPAPAAPPRRVEAAAATAPQRQAAITITLHWVSALLVLACAAAALGREWVQADSVRNTLLELHRQSGLLVLLLLAARLAARWRQGLVDHAANLHPLLKRAAQGAHLALYGLLLALPLLGLATTQAHEVTVRLLGVLPLPAFVPGDPDLAESLSDWHALAAWALLGLLVAHVAAALWHHRVRRDGVLMAMLPARAARLRRH